MSETKEITVRNMQASELGVAIEWAAKEGWNPGLHDAECFYAADPRGFFLAERNGQAAGCLSAVVYDDCFGFAGFYIVKPEFRGQGIGRQLVRTASVYLGSRTIGNDAVVAQQENYKKYGFRMAYRNIRYRGIAAAGAINAPGVTDLLEIPFREVAAYDRGLFPAERSAFLDGWINQPRGKALGYVQDGRLAGYGVIRKCRQGYKIGPLFADKEQIAEKLLLALAGQAAGEEYFLDLPEPNSGAVALAGRYGMQVVFETARMYSGPAPALPLEKIFGITSFELG